MKDSVIKAGHDEEVWIRERCYIRELINHKSIPDFSLAQTRVKPGVVTELHKLQVKEWYVIMEGTGLVEIDGGPKTEVGPGDTVVIPAGVSQRMTNTGETDLLFQCICLPRFRPDCYEAVKDDWQ